MSFTWGAGDVALIVQAVALIFWGGRIYQMLKEHERRITKLEEET